MFDMNIRFQVAALLVWILIVIDYNRNPHLRLLSTKCFRMLLILTGINLFLDMGSVYSITHLDRVSKESNRFIHQLFIGSVILTIFCNYLYVEILANEQKRLRRSRLLRAALPLVIATLMILLGQLDYHVTAKEVYSYGTMAYAVYGCGLLYLLMCFGITIHQQNSLHRYQRGSIQIGLLIWVMVLVVQMFVPSILLSGLGLTLLVLSVYFSFENQKENYDAMTGCFNHNAWYRMVTEYAEKGKHPFLVSIRFDNAIEWNEVKRVIGMFYREDIYHTRTNTFSIFQMNKPDVAVLDQLRDQLQHQDGGSVNARVHCMVIQLTKRPQEASEILDFMLEELRERESGVYEMDASLLERKKRVEQIEQMVSVALKEDGFEMFYQPIYSTQEQTFCSAEALLRMKDKETLGYLSPEEFIPIAEQKGQIIELGDRVFQMVANDIQSFAMEENGIQYIEVNLSRM